MSYNDFIGEKYNMKTPLKEISKTIKQFCLKELPGWTFSVQVKDYNALNIKILAIPEELQVFVTDHLRRLKDNPNVWYCYNDIYTAAFKTILEKIEHEAYKYNYDRSDISTDYFDVNFYLHLHLDYQFEKERKNFEIKKYLGS